MNDSNSLTIRPTQIAGLLELSMPVHADERGWFKENWQREKMVAAGLPDFHPVQNNVSFNAFRGTTRGLHAEPWDKYISVLSGKIFGAWVDLRPGAGFGTVYTATVGPDSALFIPRGVANGFQTLDPDTVYSYLVTEHWTEQARSNYSYVNLADPTLGINWPISLDEAIISEADLKHPNLDEAKPVLPKKIAVLGGTGQLGRALTALGVEDPRIEVFSRAEFDFERSGFLEGFPWANYSHVINAAAMTAVDEAETPPGRRRAWQVNSTAVASLAARCAQHDVTLVHVSTDYVFDGKDQDVKEQHPISPLSVYGQSKAAGEVAVLSHPNHVVVRTSWVVGEGKNFVDTMFNLAQRGVSPKVIDDQFGRPTFAVDLAQAIMHLIDTGQPGGTYHLQGEGEVTSWYELARRVFSLSGHDPDRVAPTSAVEYLSSVALAAPRPRNSSFSLNKIRATGYLPVNYLVRLEEYIEAKRNIVQILD
ncbi:sugar nucleotide-binding protein [Glutamicibacter sp. NPDC087344]|uniref:sugar nucleotide-binding protein n=1 Tax=Glutamicibacter sp. NPDC087344 TaxID=3363994 RepID=UPI0038206380